MTKKNQSKKKVSKGKTSKKEEKSKKEEVKSDNHSNNNHSNELENLPKEAQEKIKKLKAKVDDFQKKVVEKFDKYIMGIALLPPPKDVKEEDKDKINLLVLVDDSDSQKLDKAQLKEKLEKIITKIGEEVDKKLVVNIVIFTEVLASCYDAKYDLLQIIAMSAPVYDRGMLAALKISEIHKSMVIKKFEKYIVSYVLAGSLMQGKATATSDIDVWIVIDDTDVKKMTRAELKDKLRAIIIGMGFEAGSMTGIQNKLNIQVYILSEFWDSLREANPVIFTLLRDGVPLYDRGMFMPWKQLLKMGKIKPSPEAIDLFMGSGDQMLQRVHMKIKEIGMEDIFWAILTPSQAALMMYGIPPPTPRETPLILREIFVDKEKLLEDKFVKILERNIKVRKEIEHGVKKELSGKELDQLLKDAEEYLVRIKKLFEEIEEIRRQKDVLHIYETTLTVIRDTLIMEGCTKIDDSELVKYFEDKLISTGKVPVKYLRILNEILKAKKDYDANKLSKTESESVRKESGEFVKAMVEYMQRKRGKEFDRVKIRIKYGDKFGELFILKDKVFIIHDLDSDKKEISCAKYLEDGSIGDLSDSDYEEMEKHIVKIEIPSKVFIKEKTFEHIKRIFGKDVEILVNY
jgi:uncharacterized protein (UPF0332 family)/predicted nucleotidyltransferase